MTLHEMAEDFCRRTGGRYSADEILIHGSKNIPYFDDDGFFIVVLDGNTLYIDFFYVVPGRPKSVFKRYIQMIEFIAKSHSVRYVQATSMRKGVEVIYPKFFKPIATVYEADLNGGEYNGQKDNDVQPIDHG